MKIYLTGFSCDVFSAFWVFGTMFNPQNKQKSNNAWGIEHITTETDKFISILTI